MGRVCRRDKKDKRTNRRDKKIDFIDSPSEEFYFQGKQSKIVINPKTASQKKYINCITNNTLTFCTGVAGSGKTFIAASIAAKLLDENKYEKIYLTKPAVTAGEEFGHLPGELNEKYKPYLEPFEDIFIKQLGKGYYEYLLKVGRIVPKPMAFLRGVTFNNTIVLLDEAQNTSPIQMKLFLTRLGENCKVIVSGDTAQKDIRTQSGLDDALNRLSHTPDVAYCHFDITDCVRSDLVKNILSAYEDSNVLA